MLGDIATINNNIIEVCGRNASIQLIDGIILEQSIIDSIVANIMDFFGSVFYIIIRILFVLNLEYLVIRALIVS